MVESGLRVGPRMLSTGTILYGAEGDFKAVVNSLDDAREAVARELDLDRALSRVTYTLDGVKNLTQRPVTFAFNGGPGSSSIWLHMGILGPKRTVLADVEFNTQGPFRTVDNDYSILDRADIVRERARALVAEEPSD